MKRETRPERIRRYEEMLNEVQAVLCDAERAIDAYESVRPKIRELEKYYTSQTWKRDFSASERGELPAGLPCGVLSEDGINDLLDEDLALADRIRTLFSEEE